ncbi:uncharacterized protein HaLaN_20070 [Haematococcus lacustris]|uniref:Uncharacterized protein n=1 Tax=Haematococcus lacustris TaxID=44745 RepID=A0A699ZV28_HAELA|nr:uncharacterized protein HaLaN_20070 [Haematococcus lacustris]
MEDKQAPYAPISEPWYIGHGALLPWYDVRFKGFGFNKQMQVAYAAGNVGMRLMVLADAWLIHLPHQTTIAARLFGQGGQFNSFVQGSSAQGMSMEEARAHREALLQAAAQAASQHSSPGTAALADERL